MPCGPVFTPTFRFVCGNEEVSKGNYEKVKFWHSDPRLGIKRTYCYRSNGYRDDYECPGSRHAEHAGNENAKGQIEGESKGYA